MPICLNIPVDWELTAQVFTVIGAIGTILAVAFSAYSLKKTLYASQRPYVVCYPVYDEQHTQIVLITKNFGNSSAKIKSLKINPEISIHNHSSNNFLVDVLLAPNQQLHFITDSLKDKAQIASAS